MPYMHCPSCRLSTFSAAADAAAGECPRCGSDLVERPPSLFARGARRTLDLVQSAPRHRPSLKATRSALQRRDAG